ncbi:hypothetical protein [Glutamicibacter arilaitensis]|uniref:hypothetical protein n=1 Tax=Glutamicibacter arilaitensis TaxID=256701 RepID=UPI003FD50B07
MTKRLTLWTLPIAFMLAVTGCSAEQSSESTDSASGQAQSQKASPPAGEGKAGKLSGEQIEAIAKNLLDGDQAVQVIGNAQMQQQLKIAKEADLPSGIKPEKCAELNAKYTVTDLTASVSATATSSSQAVGKVVQIFALTDNATRHNISKALKLDDLEGCEKVKLQLGGEQIEAERQILPLDVKADQSLTMSTSMDAGGGQTLTSVAVQALKGDKFVLVTLQTGTQQAAELSAQAVQLTDQAFAGLEAAQ